MISQVFVETFSKPRCSIMIIEHAADDRQLWGAPKQEENRDSKMFMINFI